VSERQGSVLVQPLHGEQVEVVWEPVRKVVKVTLTVVVQRVAPKRVESGMIESMWSKSLFLRDSPFSFF
jgi:hypothetical protein